MKETVKVLSEDKMLSENVVVVPIRHTFTRPMKDYFLLTHFLSRGVGAGKSRHFP
jgi:hypothetical protein